jgi:hypothetical protein
MQHGIFIRLINKLSIDEGGSIVTIYVYSGTQFGGVATRFEEVTVGLAIEAEYWTSPLNLATVITTDFP